MRQTFGALGKSSEDSLESGEIEGQDKLKDQEEKRIMNYVESINIDAVKRKSKIDIEEVLEKTTKLDISIQIIF